MKLLVTLSAHFATDALGRLRALSPFATYTFFCRYVEIFDEVTVAARTTRRLPGADNFPVADGERVSFAPLPDFRGPWQYLARRRAVVRRLREAIRSCDAAILRVPCPIGTLAWRELRSEGKPFALEVLGDPWYSLGPGSVRSVARPFARRIAARTLREQCRTAPFVSYVTQSALQMRYPSLPDACTASYSSVELGEHDFASEPRKYSKPAKSLLLLGTLETLYKGVDVLLRALALCGRIGMSVNLRIGGDGRYRPWLERLARSLGVAPRVEFLGLLRDRASVRCELDRADVFVLPSRTEGLPSALLEAMARGMPCIASSVGGIPELLLPEDLVPPLDPTALARKIAEIVRDPGRLTRMSARNLEKAREYESERLKSRRVEFYERLRRAASEWAKARKGAS